MLNLCITFDYELFLGENFLPAREILFQPSASLAEMLRQEEVPGTFFADVCSVMQHERYGLTDYCNGFSEQLRFLYGMGHDVQLHIHSNWLNSTYRDGKWQISPEGYKLHDFGFDASKEDAAPAILRRGKEYLEQALRGEYPKYRCVAYRAGGFCIQPECELLQTLVELGIRIDSSVAISQVSRAAIQDYDFSHVPHRLGWWIDPCQGIGTASPRGADTVYEVAIGAARNRPSKFLGISKSGLHVAGRHGAGIGIKMPGNQPGRAQRLYLTVKRRLFSDGILSLDTRGYQVLLRDIEEIYRRYSCMEQDQYVAIICHPKLASAETIENMSRFIHEVKRSPQKYSFATMRDIAKKLEI